MASIAHHHGETDAGAGQPSRRVLACRVPQPGDGRQHERSFPKQADAVRRRRQQLDALDRGRWVDREAGKVSFLRYFQARERD